MMMIICLRDTLYIVYNVKKIGYGEQTQRIKPLKQALVADQHCMLVNH